MLTGPELALLLLVIFVVFGLHKLPDFSEAVARLRLKFDKSIAEDAIAAAVENRDDETGNDAANDTDERRGTP